MVVPGMNAGLPGCLRTGAVGARMGMTTSFVNPLAVAHVMDEGSGSYAGASSEAHALEFLTADHRWIVAPPAIHRLASNIFDKDEEVQLSEYYECVYYDDIEPIFKDLIPEDVASYVDDNMFNEANEFWKFQYFPALCNVLKEPTSDVDIVGAAEFLYANRHERVRGRLPLPIAGSIPELVWRRMVIGGDSWEMRDFLLWDSILLFLNREG